MKNIATLFLLVTLPLISFSQNNEQKIDDILQKMTVEEKVGQLCQPVLDEVNDSIEQLIADGKVGSFCSFNKKYYTPAERNRLQKIAVEQSRLGIPIIFTYDVIHGFSTVYPTSLGLSASWDTALAGEVAAMAAREARHYGVDMTFSPMVDVSRDPRWGRIAECYGEDVLLNESFGAATVRGYQGNDLTDHNNIGSCIKHFVGYGVALGGRDKQFTEISERSLLETYLPPFKACVDAGAVSVMTAFNDISGVPATAHEYALSQVLKDDWGFEGFTLSDWDAVLELMIHGIAGTKQEAAEKALNAGTDMEMRSDTYRQLGKSIEEGKVSMATVDEAVRRILRVKFMLGLFDNPYIKEKVAHSYQLTEENRALARMAGAQSVVLLKNNGILPLSKGMNKITLTGPFAHNKDMLGWWIGNGEYSKVITLDEGVQNKLSNGRVIVGSEAKNYSPTTIVCLGESGKWFGETNCLSDINLPQSQIELVKETKKLGSKVIVVIFNGRPLALSSIMEYADAILLAWHPGTEAGNAVADVLFGDVNPGGKLTCTFPKESGQIPLFYSDRMSGRPRNNYYLDVDAEPLFPFGYGLSYTSYKYTNLKLKSATVASNKTLSLTVDVTNTGHKDGSEVVQLYVHDKVASVTRPKKELIGFKKVALKAGETKTVSFEIPVSELAFYGIHNQRIVEPGEFDIWVGGSSVADLHAVFHVVE